MPNMKQKKLDSRERLAQILSAAVAVAERDGFQRMTRESIAKRAGVADALVTYHMGTMQELRRAVMREAIRSECLGVLAQGIAARDPRALKAPADLQRKALASLAVA